MNKQITYYKGQPLLLQDYTKEQLIEIIIEMMQMQEQASKRHLHELEVVLAGHVR